MRSNDSDFAVRPFQITPGDDQFVLSETARQAVKELKECVHRGDGIALLTGPPGTGKTTICQELALELRPALDVVLLSSSGCPTRRSLLQSVLFELKSAYVGLSEQEARLEIISYARSSVVAGRGLTLIVDEAHQLPPRLLEQLRTLTNHIEQGHPLIRLVLAGTLELEELLILPQMDALNQRVVCHVTLEPLNRQQSAEHIARCLERIGECVEDVYSPDALELICHASDGLLRCLHRLCESSLLLATECGGLPVSAEIVRRAFGDLQQLPLQWNSLPVESELLGNTSPAEDSECESISNQEADMETPTVNPTMNSNDTCTTSHQSIVASEWTSPIASFEVGMTREDPKREAAVRKVESHSTGDQSAHTQEWKIEFEDRSSDDSEPAETSSQLPMESPDSHYRETRVADRYAELDRAIETSPSRAPRSSRASSKKKAGLSARANSGIEQAHCGECRETEGAAHTFIKSAKTPDEIIERVMSVLGELSGDSRELAHEQRDPGSAVPWTANGWTGSNDDADQDDMRLSDTIPWSSQQCASIETPLRRAAEDAGRVTDESRPAVAYSRHDYGVFDVIDPPGEDSPGYPAPEPLACPSPPQVPPTRMESSHQNSPDNLFSDRETTSAAIAEADQPYLRLFSRLRRVRAQ